MKNYLLLYALLLFCLGLHAQTTEKNLKQSKDYLNSKFTYLLLQELVQDPKYRDTLDNISSSFVRSSINRPLPFSQLAENLKGKFDDVLKKFSEPVDKINITPLTSQENEHAAAALVDSVFAVLSRSYSNKYHSLLGRKEEFTDTILTFLNPHYQVGYIDNNDTATTKPKDSFNFVTLILFVLIAAIAVFGYRELQSVKRRIEAIRAIKTSNSNSNSPKNFPDSTYKSPIQKSDVARFIDNNETIAGFQKAIENLQVRLSKLEEIQGKPPGQQVAQSGATSLPVQQDVTAADETFYMTLPINNYFLVKSKSVTKDNTIYKFTVRPNSREAYFSIHISGSQLTDVLSVIETYIKPACDEENVADQNVRNIITLEPGLAVLEADKWVIKKKALIRYE